MPDRPPTRSGQLHDISEAIGELRAYVHEGRHGVNNVSQKIDGLGVDIARRFAAQEEKNDVWRREMEKRLSSVEASLERQAGAKNVVTWFLQSPLVGWIVAGVLFFAGIWAKGSTQ